MVQSTTAGHLFSFLDRELSEDIQPPINEVPTNLRKASSSSSSSEQITTDGQFSLANCESYFATWYVLLHVIYYSQYIYHVHLIYWCYPIHSSHFFSFKTIQHCTSYLNRLFDLHHSCFFGDSGCQCEDAKRRVDNNEILCEKGITECPDDCTVCSKCMRDLGCLE